MAPSISSSCRPLGGVTFEALSLGKRVITYVDLKSAAEFFGEAPPVLSCFTADEIAEAMLRIMDDPADLAEIGLASQSWVRRYHSADRIVAIQAEVYRKIRTASGSCRFSRRAAIEGEEFLIERPPQSNCR